MKMGSAAWRLRYQLKRKPWLLPILLVGVIMLLTVGVAWVADDAAPETASSVARKSGPPIHDGWGYNGYDSDGNLIFQKGEKVMLLAPDSKELTLSGRRYLLEEHKSDYVKLSPAAAASTPFSLPSGLLWLLAGIGIGFAWRGRKPRPGPRRPWPKARW